MNILYCNNINKTDDYYDNLNEDIPPVIEDNINTNNSIEDDISLSFKITFCCLFIFILFGIIYNIYKLQTYKQEQDLEKDKSKQEQDLEKDKSKQEQDKLEQDKLEQRRRIKIKQIKTRKFNKIINKKQKNQVNKNNLTNEFYNFIYTISSNQYFNNRQKNIFIIKNKQKIQQFIKKNIKNYKDKNKSNLNLSIDEEIVKT